MFARVLSQPEPASVPEYQQHVLIKLNAPEGHAARERGHGSWWQAFVEKEPSVFEAFKALAKHQDAVNSTVKITAFDDVGFRQQPAVPGTCDVIAFPEGVRYRNLPLTSLGDVVLHAVADNPAELPPLHKDVQKLQEDVPEVVLLVCCHGARDARCGAVGPTLAAKLLSLVRSQDLQDRIKVYKTSHVGGSKYAGNVLVFGAIHPCDGDWFGGLNADNAAEFLESLVHVEIGTDGGAEDLVLRQWWRGRMGLAKEEQRGLWEQGGGIENWEGAEGADEEEDEGEWQVEEGSMGDEEVERLLGQPKPRQ
ncbi:hypothetical protein N2152v2_007654 [Parachlorella kessleri]